ncbi:MAG TPA: SIMPL domain-containing protein [Flavobacterium sp.]|nr:SIMPL domain-containing protein [Flavobacterium sp.]
MKKTFLILFTTLSALTQAQEIKPIPTVNVTGEGKIKIVPDQVSITIGVESKGTNSVEVKKENDIKIDAVLKSIKKFGIAKEDFQTARVALYPNYDYEKKRQTYGALQTIEVLLRDLSKYDALMSDLTATGVNRIDNVIFKSSQFKQLQSDARKLAVKDAKAKAEDFATGLGQKIGRAVSISDNSQGYEPPRPVMYKAMAMADAGAPERETLAPGELEVIVNVNVSFVLE